MGTKIYSQLMLNVELPHEDPIDHIMHHSDVEDGISFGGAEESVDLMAQCENS